MIFLGFFVCLQSPLNYVLYLLVSFSILYSSQLFVANPSRVVVETIAEVYCKCFVFHNVL